MTTNKSDKPTNPSPNNAPAPIRIWLVDDDERLRAAMAELLALMGGLECTRSFGSASAVLSALASKAGPDVMLLDIHMKNENGLDALRSLQSLSPATRVLMFTTFADRAAEARALADGAAGFLRKHDSLERIVESIRAAQASPRPMRRRRRRNCGPPAVALAKPRVKL